MREAAGALARPGIVLIAPQIGYTNPAPTDARTSRTSIVCPVGAPLSEGSPEIDRWVFAMQTGIRPNPFSSYVFSCWSAVAVYCTRSAP